MNNQRLRVPLRIVWIYAHPTGWCRLLGGPETGSILNSVDSVINFAPFILCLLLC